MKRAILCLLVALVLPFHSVQAGSYNQAGGPYRQYIPLIAVDREGWELVTEGIEYQHWTLPDPNQIYVTRMDRSIPSVFLESSIGTGELVNGRETVSNMADRYNQAINYWGGSWGGRNKVVVAINGDYFDPPTGYPENGQVQGGWYTKRYNDYEGWSGFAWTMDGDAFIGQCIVNPPDGQYITFANPEVKQQLDAVNAPRGENDLVLYTYQYATTTLTDDTGVEVLVTMNHPASVVPTPRSVKGRVAAIKDLQGSSFIPFDGVILSAHGSARETLLANIEVGDEIGITQEIQALDKDCQKHLPQDWTNTYASIGGAFTFLSEGEPQHLDVVGAIARHPRTAIAMNERYIFFIVVDGRAPGVSVGMSLDELAVFTRDTLHAAWGIAQDGGGSSTMVINGHVINSPSDPCHRKNTSRANRPIASTLPQVGTVETTIDVIPEAGSGVCERQVANGMMMVVGEPMDQSRVFVPGMAITTATSTNVRLGPGTNFGSVGTLPANSRGVILHHETGLDGVLAKYSYWWYAAFGDIQGWIRQENIVLPWLTLVELPTDR